MGDAVAFARRALSREPNDTSAIDAGFLQAITDHLTRYGADTLQFLFSIQPEDGPDGSIICMSCYADVQPLGRMGVGALASWERHIQVEHGARPKFGGATLHATSSQPPASLTALGPHPAASGQSKSTPPPQALVKRKANDLDAEGLHIPPPPKRSSSSPAASASANALHQAQQRARDAASHLSALYVRQEALHTRLAVLISTGYDPFNSVQAQFLQSQSARLGLQIADAQTEVRRADREARRLSAAAIAHMPQMTSEAENVNPNSWSDMFRKAASGFFDGLSEYKDVKQPYVPVAGPSRDQEGSRASLGSSGRRKIYDGDSDDGKPAAARTIADVIQHIGQAFAGDTTVDKARTSLGVDAQGRVKGLTSILKPHQLLGVDWMLEQERSHLKGGILADDMGLGKTFQTIATCVLNPSQDPERKSTLVIAPRSVLRQWEREIENHANGELGLKVLIYRGPDKPKSRKVIRKHDFVVTTVHAILAELGTEGSSDWGPLLRMRWHRVVIDEAHIIRNRGGKWSKAMLHFESRYRWTLTGTPFVNGLADVFPLLRFLRVTPWDDWGEFRRHIVAGEKRNPQRSSERMQVILQECMLRRRKDAMLNGERLVQLPSKEITMQEVVFSPDELSVYQTIEAKAQKRVSKFLKQRSVLKNYSHIFALIMRLRQACCHPALVLENGDEALHAGTSDEGAEAEFEHAVKLLSNEDIVRMRSALLKRAAAALDAVGNDEDDLERECPICLDGEATDEVIIPCGHTGCRTCMMEAVEKRGAKCSECRQDFNPEHIFASKAFEPNDDEINAQTGRSSQRTEHDDAQELDDEGNVMRKKRGKTGKGSSKRKRKDDKKSAGVMLSDEPKLVPRDITPSRKMIFLYETLQRIEQEEPGAKTVVISSFVSYLAIIEDFLEQKGIKTVRFTGQDSDEDREEAIEQFTTNNRVTVMLLSLRAGGVGLNLCVANRVIPVDMAWNRASEEQAYDRVHRLGQQKDVKVHRVMIQSTIEARMLDIQNRKGALADGALGENGVRKLTRLSVKDIANLFGLDARGNVQD